MNEGASGAHPTNLSGTAGSNPLEKEQDKFSSELQGLLKHGANVWLVIMPPSVRNVVHLDAAIDLERFTLPALERLVTNLRVTRRLRPVLPHFW